jgi:hypothetical protein
MELPDPAIGRACRRTDELTGNGPLSPKKVLDESPPDGKTSSKMGVVPSGDSQCFIPVTPKRDATDENP